MRYAIGLAIAEMGLIFVRATSANLVPVWSLMWWVWIIATVVVAWCCGLASHVVAVERGWMRPVQPRNPARRQ